jgi:hypothetical protein
MKIIYQRLIPQEDIEAAHWFASLPVTKVGRFTVRIYKAVAHIEAARQMGRRSSANMRELGAILIEPAGSPGVLDEIVRAKKILDVIPRDRKRSGIGDLLNAPAAGIRNKSKRPITLQFVEAVDQLQKELDRRPTRAEIIARIGLESFSEGECTRQVKRLGWEEVL